MSSSSLLVTGKFSALYETCPYTLRSLPGGGIHPLSPKIRVRSIPGKPGFILSDHRAPLHCTVFDPETKRPIVVHAGHLNEIWALCCVPSSDCRSAPRVFSGERGQSVTGKRARIWDVDTGVLIHLLQNQPKYSVVAEHFPRIPSARRDVFVGSFASSAVRRYDVEIGVATCVFAGHKSHVFGIAADCETQLLFTSCAQVGILVWDLRTGKRVRRLGAISSVGASLRFDEDTRCIVSCGTSGTVSTVDSRTDSEILTFKVHNKASITDVVKVGTDSFASCGFDRCCKLWHPSSGKVVSEFRPEKRASPLSLCLLGEMDDDFFAESESERLSFVLSDSRVLQALLISLMDQEFFLPMCCL